MNIKHFTLNKDAKQLEIQLSNAENDSTTQSRLNCSFEFLRVFSPSEWQKIQPEMPTVFHKKHVQLNTIESVGKHGYRFIFDDGHSDLFTPEYMENITKQHDALWDAYLAKTNNAGNNREQAIDITQL